MSRRAQIMLPELQQNRPHVTFNLQPMQIRGHFDLGNHVLAVQHAAPLLHVQNLDRENVRGLPQFLVCEKERCRFFLFDAPPFHRACQPPNPPRPQPPHPPPNPPPPDPPPQLPRDPRPELAIIPSKNHNRPLPPDPPPRSPRPPEARPRNENRIINPTKSQKIPLPPPLFL